MQEQDMLFLMCSIAGTLFHLDHKANPPNDKERKQKIKALKKYLRYYKNQGYLNFK